MKVEMTSQKKSQLIALKMVSSKLILLLVIRMKAPDKLFTL